MDMIGISRACAKAQAAWVESGQAQRKKVFQAHGLCLLNIVHAWRSRTLVG
jgi:hypothetical protein